MKSGGGGSSGSVDPILRSRLDLTFFPRQIDNRGFAGETTGANSIFLGSVKNIGLNGWRLPPL